VTFEKYDVFDDPYCYRGTDCLKNRLGLRDSALLQAFEVEMTTLRADEPLPDGRFGPAHYRRIHWHLFRDVYRWAGRYRTVRTAKDGNWFCYPEHIDGQMKQLFRRTVKKSFKPGAGRAKFISAATEFLAELNAIHPFREGNGRVQLAFLHLLGLRAGHPLHLERVRPETFMPAMVKSFHGDLMALTAELEALTS
jgi:cell filamentation protein